MVESNVDICNIALSMLGEGRISTLPGTTDKGILLNLLFTPILDQALREHNWAFAITRQTLAVSAETNNTPHTYMYQLPTDPQFVKFLSLLNSNSEEVIASSYPHYIEGQYLYSDLESAKLKYIGRVTDYTKLDSTFVLYFAAYLAKEVALRLTNDLNLANRLEGKAEYYLRKAISHDAEDNVIEESVDYWDEVIG